MTMPRYPNGCPAESQVRGVASSPDASDPDYAWIVNFNNGNVNLNNRNNTAFVRAVRGPVAASECQGEQVSYRDLHAAWQRARRNKVPSAGQLHFESNWMERLLDLQRNLLTGTWSPLPTTCFVAQRPKAREIHAPAFSDRVVHHWLVPQLEAIFEPGFIHDSFANRRGRGTHAAVARLRRFVRQVHSGQGGGWYLQLDIRNFFNTVHRPTLYRILKARLERAGASLPVRRAVHALLRHPVARQGVRHLATPAQRALVPRHKRLEAAPAGCGLPIGNLSSQFFANVYLDRLDQFVKHTLRAPRYLRYVDDFVLVHHDRAQLEAWRVAIEHFLRRELRLELKDDIRLRRLTDGIDFLGYVVYPTHTRVRRRVIGHVNEALSAWERRHVAGDRVRGTPEHFRGVRSSWASYLGHLRHANGHRLQQRMHRRYPWLDVATTRSFHHTAEGRVATFAIDGMSI
jgi:RNA-directed DNA polymerase